MIREREHVIARISLVIQTTLTVVLFFTAWWIVHDLRPGQLFKSRECVFFLTLIIPLWWLLIEYSGLNQLCRSQKYTYLLLKYLKLVGLGTGILAFVSFVWRTEQLTLDVLVWFAIIDFCLLFLFKIFFFRTMKFFRKRGYNTRQILVIADHMSEDYVGSLLHTKDWGYKVWGIMTSDEQIKTDFEGKAKILPGETPVEEILDKATIDEVFYCKGVLDQQEITRLVHLCAEIGVVFRLKPSLLVAESMRSGFSFFNDMPFFVFRNTPENYLAMKIKRIFDFVFSLVAIILASPVFLVIAIAIKLDDGGPVLFSQERVGLNGRRFSCLKFRTMVVNAEALRQQLMDQNEQTGPVFKIRMDPRITRVGKLLRKTSLDELPQFFNVISGDMSVVGPRPPIPSEVEQYERWQSRRLSMKPGITCIWQVSGRNNIDFEDWVKLDVQYIDNWSLMLDFKIILKTIKVMIMGDGQ